MLSLPEARIQAMQAARDLLEGRLDALQAARLIDEFRFVIEPDLHSEPFLVFAGIASESDHLMMSDRRKGPPSEATTPLWAEYLETDAFYRKAAEDAAKALLAILDDRPT